MQKIKNLRILGIIFTILCLVFSMFFINNNASAAITISTSASEYYIEKTVYNFTTKYIDTDGNTVESDTTDSITLAGNTYYPTIKSVTGETLSDGRYKGYKYAGYYYIDEVGIYSSGSLSNLLTNDPPYVTTESQGKDSASGVGNYTIYIVYEVYYDDDPGSSSGSSGSSSGSSGTSSGTSSGSSGTSSGSSSGTESSGTSTEISSGSSSGSSSGGQAATTSGTSTSGNNAKESSNPSTGDMYPLLVLMIFIIPFALLSFSSLLYNHQQSRNIKF